MPLDYLKLSRVTEARNVIQAYAHTSPLRDTPGNPGGQSRLEAAIQHKQPGSKKENKNQRSYFSPSQDLDMRYTYPGLEDILEVGVYLWLGG